MKKYAIAAAAIGSLAISQPGLAQDTAEDPPKVTIEVHEADEGDEGEDDFFGMGADEDNPFAMAIIGALISTMFQADPLTADAEARLPQAQQVAGSLVPEGVYGAMMTEMLDSFTSPIFEMAKMGGGMSADDLAIYTGLSTDQTGSLSSEERSELTAIFDPVHEERATADMSKVTALVGEVFEIIEPGMREGLSKAYAARFTDAELAELNAFFATPTGAKYAAQSLPVQADKHVIAGMMQSVPTLLERLPQVVEAIESNEGNGLPEPRRYDDLTPSEQRRAAALLGVEQTMLRESMAMAEAMEEEVMIEDAWEPTIDEDDDAIDSAADDAADAMEDAAAE
ncbi:DUF2059 domain-containing protein [Alteriqipengyuania sp.]|uniref:DUF2059 domain-containing protein n=1 Tax=Alteriqipengyuania sp. TaxID=2800692 RepID=UPI0035194E18